MSWLAGGLWRHHSGDNRAELPPADRSPLFHLHLRHRLCCCETLTHMCNEQIHHSHFIIPLQSQGFHAGHQAMRKPGMQQEAVIACIAFAAALMGMHRAPLRMFMASLILSRPQA